MWCAAAKIQNQEFPFHYKIMCGKTATSLPYSVHTMVPDHQDCANSGKHQGTLALVPISLYIFLKKSIRNSGVRSWEKSGN
jgi:hypothetical protein